MSSPRDQLEVFRAGAEQLVSEAELLAKLERGRPLRIKYGCDPSAPDLHLGHTVGLSKLRRLQELGHTIIFLIGDFTALIGDPSGRSKTRPALSREQVRANASTYTEQVGALLDTRRAEIRFNSEWMDRLSSADLVRLASHQPVARMLERDDFRKRFQAGSSISIHEFLYPLVQAYDSVVLEADVELGGTDQTFNFLLGREIQRAYGQEAQVVLTLPLLEGLDGSAKMSKSLGNAIGVREAPEEMYGKVMSISDALLPRWLALLGEPGWNLPSSGNPRDLKAALARQLVERFHGADAGRAAEAHFDRVFRQHRAPEELETFELPASEARGCELLAALVASGLAASRGEGRRLVQQGGLRVDEQRIESPDHWLTPGEHVLQAGKRRFARVRVGQAR
ncbi:MAG TPA: tyrosine--tRNA ligase [Myxococcota bacterium]|nr:tyrosine--tRNA ligase [Myxococcota bacterium]